LVPAERVHAHDEVREADVVTTAMKEMQAKTNSDGTAA
jgi:hypothetical protein